MTRDEAERFLYAEARLLDDRRLDDWLALFEDECLYWLPIGEGDTAREPSIVYDDRRRLEERVFRLNETRAYAQEPPSRTQHTVSNVEVEPGADGLVLVHSHLVLFEVRVGDASQSGLGVPQTLAARCEHRLRRRGDSWRIARKTVWLLTRDQPLGNISFLV
jgi:3-phenylpropionate/cinnamic acid dioxygenase small subunit